MIGWFLIIDLIGLVLGYLLFWRRPLLTEPVKPGLAGSGDVDDTTTLSVIIPARNEAQNLPAILASLKSQTRIPDEIICADDGSTDETAAIAAGFGVRVLSLHDKPEGWLGKSWACHKGAQAASGDLLLFLDADITLGPRAIEKLLATKSARPGVISVLPHHRVRRLYEYASVFFNLIQAAGNGAGLPFTAPHAGLFGPAILISRADYDSVGGHRDARRSVLEDFAFARSLAASEIPDHLFFGGEDITYRMYGEGIRQLARGWIKNMASGAVETPPYLFWMTMLWLTGCFGIFFDTLRTVVRGNMITIAALPTAILLVLFIIQIIWASRRVGNFHPLVMFFFPIWLFIFMIIFMLSVIFKLFGIKVVWKDRKVDPCS